MADFYAYITPEQNKLIQDSTVFFVATADPNLEASSVGAGPVNLSPKGGVPLQILNSNQVAYLDYVGSGNETVRHSLQGGPLTIMVCAFDQENAAVVRLYGRASTRQLDDDNLSELLHHKVAEDIALPERQLIVVDIEGTSTSCGYGVPVMSFEADRTIENRGRLYKQKKILK